jgi:hypothetical protein
MDQRAILIIDLFQLNLNFMNVIENLNVIIKKLFSQIH